MNKFITIKCRNCSSVIYSLPENEIIKLKHVNLVCEDCTYHNIFENFEKPIDKLEYYKTY